MSTVHLKNVRFPSVTLYKKFLHEVGGPGYQKSRIEVSQVLMTFNCQRSKHNGGLNVTCKAQSLGISEYANLNNCCWWGGKKELSCKTM